MPFALPIQHSSLTSTLAIRRSEFETCRDPICHGGVVRGGKGRETPLAEKDRRGGEKGAGRD